MRGPKPTERQAEQTERQKPAVMAGTPSSAAGGAGGGQAALAAAPGVQVAESCLYFLHAEFADYLVSARACVRACVSACVRMRVSRWHRRRDVCAGAGRRAYARVALAPPRPACVCVCARAGAGRGVSLASARGTGAGRVTRGRARAQIRTSRDELADREAVFRKLESVGYEVGRRMTER